jgi:phospho-N-acetylmuramoyl-pentapeptide-transferase
MTQMLIAAGISFAVCVVAYPFYIGLLKRRQMEQFIRVEGPQSHAAKAKTPTMGGLLFLLVTGFVAACVFVIGFIGTHVPKLTFIDTAGMLFPPLAVVLAGVMCGLVGLVDDLSKINSKSNAGISAKTRLSLEFAFGFALTGALFLDQSLFQTHFAPVDQLVLLPNSPPLVLGGFSEIFRLGYVFAVVPFLVAATTNAINLHDGMDGLSAGTSMLVFITLAAMLAHLGGTTGFSIVQPLSVVAASIAGGLAAFLIYNRYPAKVFMGDTGSLFLGGMMAAIVAASGLTLWFVPLALIYILETVSVILQVGYFKLTKDYEPETPMSEPALIWLKLTKRLPGEGKRLFRMAPLHHHFEAVAEDKGIREWQVVACFWLAQLLICAVVLFCFLRSYKE